MTESNLSPEQVLWLTPEKATGEVLQSLQFWYGMAWGNGDLANWCAEIDHAIETGESIDCWKLMAVIAYREKKTMAEAQDIVFEEYLPKQTVQ